jgi:hypothetical protein
MRSWEILNLQYSLQEKVSQRDIYIPQLVNRLLHVSGRRDYLLSYASRKSKLARVRKHHGKRRKIVTRQAAHGLFLHLRAEGVKLRDFFFITSKKNPRYPVRFVEGLKIMSEFHHDAGSEM